MSNPRLPKILYSLWPKYRWTPMETGFERIYKCSAGDYMMSVEVRGGNTYLTLARNYNNPESPISVVGTSVGVTSESVRRAYLEAKLAWMELHALPLDPTKAETPDVVEDQDYMKKLFGLK